MGRFKHIISVLLLLTALATSAADYATTARRAERFFEGREWASAQALYGILLDIRPDADSVYVRAIVASSMLGQNERASSLLADAMKAGVSFSRLMGGVKDVSFTIGEPAVYERFLERSQHDCPWLTRALDDELLSYYMFRDNGEQTIAYAKKMLSGLPDSVKYLAALAKGYACCGDFDNATATWKQILNIEPDHYDTLLQLGNYYAIVGDNASALPYLNHALSIRATPYLSSLVEKLKE